MIQFDKPQNLNGAELIKELLAVGIQIDTNTSPYIDGLGDFYLDIVEGDVDVAAEVVAAHNGTTIKPDYVSQKTALLEKLGITEEEAKLLLS